MHQHLLLADGPVVTFGRLIAALRHDGARAGWLEWSSPSELESPSGPESCVAATYPESLDVAAGQGVLRAVAIGGGRSVAVKPMRGAPVLRDVLREHFRGCRLVLVVGEVDAPKLEPDGEDWKITVPGRAAMRWTTEKLIAALRKPSPWG